MYLYVHWTLCSQRTRVIQMNSSRMNGCSCTEYLAHVQGHLSKIDWVWQYANAINQVDYLRMPWFWRVLFCHRVAAKNTYVVVNMQLDKRKKQDATKNDGRKQADEPTTRNPPIISIGVKLAI